ncbi:MAG: CAF17-like 4Fe-4S cluster assembly/insertion protein YgfZ [Shimia sp.]
MRRLIRVTGTDREAFLQGLVTNDVGKLSDGLVYAAMLTPQGKYLVDFLLVPDGDGILIDVAADQAEPLAAKLSMYKLRADVALEWDDRQVAQGDDGDFADPRHPSLGARSYGAEARSLPDWDARRVAAAVPEAGRELGPDSYILEMGFERLGGVDFRKGCYVGQEVTARMKHKTELRKGLARVTLSAPVPEGTEIVAGGKAAGTVHTVAGTQALAYVRFDRMGEDARAGEASVSLA